MELVLWVGQQLFSPQASPSVACTLHSNRLEIENRLQLMNLYFLPRDFLADNSKSFNNQQKYFIIRLDRHMPERVTLNELRSIFILFHNHCYRKEYDSLMNHSCEQSQ